MYSAFSSFFIRFFSSLTVIFGMLIIVMLSNLSFAAYSYTINNSLATQDQRELDQLAIKIYQNYSFKELRREAASVYTKAYGKLLSAEAQTLLQPMIDELVFSAIQKAINDDPYHPKVYWVNAGPRRWFGLEVPGGRYSYDNPDAIYRIVPIDGSLRYVIHGKRHTNQLGDVTFSLIEDPNSQKTIAILTNKELVLNADGSYEVTIDNNPANGRVNHIQSTRKARQLYVRNNFGDWQNSLPDTLSVELLDNNKNHFTESEFVIVTKARRNLSSSILDYGFGALGVKTKIHPVNTLPQPQQSDKLGTLVSQASSFGHFELDDDHALVVTLNPGGASYFVMPATGPWTITLNPGACQCSLNNAQAFVNSDGNYRFVISHKDPGVYNWISTCGLHEGTMMVRWQGLPARITKLGAPSIQTQVVALSDLLNVLPIDTRWVTALERNKLQSERLDSYLQRSVESR